MPRLLRSPCGRLAAAGAVLLLSGTLAAQNDFADDFERPDGPVDGWTVASGSWSIQGGRLFSAVAEGWLWADQPPLVLEGDFGLSMEVGFPTVAADAVGRHGGIMFFAGSATERNGNTGYTLDWIDRASDHGFRLIRWDGAGLTTLVGGTPAVAEPPALWEVSVAGDRILVIADGETVIDVTDNTYRQGHFGLWTYANSDMLVDSVALFSGGPGLRACFNATPQSGDAPLDVSFDAGCSAGGAEESITSYDWNFGDGATAAGISVSHTFAAPDSYTVTLTVRGSAGGTASTRRTIDVFDPDDSPPLDVERLLNERVKRYGAEADSTVVFNEVMYHPRADEAMLEWFELYNQMAVAIDLSGWTVGEGVFYEIPRGTVIPGGGFLVIASNPAALEQATGFAGALGPFAGRLDNGGESLALFNLSGRKVAGFRYRDGERWPAAPDGSGVSLAKLDPLSASGPAENWTWSAQIGGTPGAPNFSAAGGSTSRPPGAISYWSFDEAGGLAFDAFGGHTGDLGAGTARAAGIVGRSAVDLDNTADAFINVGDGGGDFAVTEGITIEALVEVAWSGSTLDGDMIFRKEDGNARILLGFQHDGNGDGRSLPPLAPAYTGPVLAFGLNVGGSYSELEVPLDGQAGRPTVDSLRAGDPHHIAATYDRVSGEKAIYLDGTLVAAINLGSGSPVESGGSSSAYIGNMTGRGQPFTGVIDELALWSRALSAAEVLDHHDRAGEGRSYFSEEVVPSRKASLAFNEFEVLALDDYRVELHNFGDAPVSLLGHTITAGGASGLTFGAETLPTGGYLVLSRDDLGFDLAADGKLFLYAPGGQSVVDAVKIRGSHRGRYPEGTGRWLFPEAPALGGPNRFSFEGSVVINEIHYHPRLEPAKADVFSETTVFPIETEWRYDASGRDLETAWRASDFDDSDWPLGLATFFHEDGALPAPKNTEIQLGPTTFYFRKTFEVASPLAGELAMRLLADDGAVVYLNGVEVLRSNMPAGPITASTLAETGVGNATFTGPFSLAASSLRAGTNVIAVEVHQAAPVSSDVVFAAEMSARLLVERGHPAREPPESWLELLNTGSGTIDLTGWELDEGIDYAFEPGTLLGPAEYLVVAEDSVALRAKYPGVRIVGDFSGRLSNSTDRLVLKDARGNPADEVEYFDGGRWPVAADGGGSTLELRDPLADNSKGEAWAASDETGRSGWRTYSYREVAVANVGPTRWREFVIGLLDRGEILVDDLSVIQSPDSAPQELLQNGDFERGSDAWRFLGNHRHSAVIEDPDRPGNQVLHLAATGPTEHMHNHLETTLAGNRSAPNGLEYQVSFRARWLTGSNQFNTRLYFNRVPETTLIDVPDLAGTPGFENSTFAGNIGPTFDRLRHFPVVPQAGEAVTLSVFAGDPDGVAAVRAWWSVDGGAWQSTPMAPEPGVDSLYVGRVPGQSAGRVVQFYVEAEDGEGAASTFPAGGAESRALYKVEDGQSRPGPIHNFRIIMTAQDANFLHAETNVMSNERLGATVVYREEEVFYDVGCRLKGSQRGRPGGSRVSFSVEFQPDALFRGAHRRVSCDRAGGWGIGAGPTGQDEIMVKHTTNMAGLPGMYDDIAWLVAPRSAQNGPTLLMMAKYSSVFRRTQYPGDSEGTMYKVELIYYPTTTVDGNPESLKRPLPDEVLGTDLRDLGDEREPYRWNFILESNEDRDDYTRFIALSKAMGASGAAFQQGLEELLDIDEATRMYAIRTLCGINDTYWFAANFHNVMLYELATEGRFVYLGWDDDVAFSRATNAALWGGPNLARLYSIPQYQRLFYSHLHDLTGDIFNVQYLRRWTEHYGELAQEEASFSTVLNYLNARSRFARNSLPPPVAFAITTNGGDDFTVDTASVTIEGSGWIDIRTILVAGLAESPAVSWTARDGWRTTVPLRSGANRLDFLAFDFGGNLLASDSITVTSTAEPEPGWFIRGDSNQDENVDLSDAVATLLHLFRGRELTCRDAADANDDELLNLSDPIYTLEHLFRGGPRPPPPYPQPGGDTTGDGSLECL